MQEDGLLYGFGSDRAKVWRDIEYKPARILAPGQVVLPLEVAYAIAGEDSQYNRQLPTCFALEARSTMRKEITRAEAERREGNQ